MKNIYVAKLLAFPARTKVKMGPNEEAWCHFHKTHGHDTNNGYTLQTQIERLKKEGFIEMFLKRDQHEEVKQLSVIRRWCGDQVREGK